MSNDNGSSDGTDITTISANHTLEEGRAIGGKLTLTSTQLQFVPTGKDKSTGGKEFDISLRDIEEIGRKKKFSSSLKDTLTGGGLRDRLRIELSDGTEELFVVSNLSEVIDEFKKGVKASTETDGTFCLSCGKELSPETQFCPDCGTENGLSEQDVEIEVGDGASNSGSLILKLIAYFFGGSGLLMGTFFALSGSVVAGVLLILAGVFGTPITRRRLGKLARVNIGRWVATLLYLIFWFAGSIALGP